MLGQRASHMRLGAKRAHQQHSCRSCASGPVSGPEHAGVRGRPWPSAASAGWRLQRTGALPAMAMRIRAWRNQGRRGLGSKGLHIAPDLPWGESSTARHAVAHVSKSTRHPRAGLEAPIFHPLIKVQTLVHFAGTFAPQRSHEVTAAII